MKHIAILLSIFLVGCAPVVVNSTPKTVVIKNASPGNASQQLADAECQKYDRWAVHIPDNQRDGYMTFECKDE